LSGGIGEGRNKGEGMIWQSVRHVLLASAFTAAVALAGRAEEAAPPVASAPAPACCEAAPQYRTVCCTEWVAEQVPCTRTVYKAECRTETYTAYKCECVPETRTRVCTVYKMVPETRTEVRNVCVTVPCVEERTVMQTFVTCQPVTTMCRRCVDKGHYECREVPCEEKHHHKHHLFGHKKDCCEPCCEPCCPPPTKTVKVWVPCPTWEEYPVTKMVRSCECRPVTCKVTTCKTEVRQESYQVTCCKCVPEQKTETYTCYTTRTVPCQATRTVSVCVPVQETYTVCRMVPHTVTKQVAVETCCATPCCSTTCCVQTCCKSKHHHSGGLHSRHTSCCE